MARDAWIEDRLMRWAGSVTVGEGSGYPVMSVLHEDWQPPSPGITPTLKADPASDVRQTHRAIAALSMRLRNTIVVRYCMRLSVADQALRLDCEESTVHARIEQAHRQLARLLASQPGAWADVASSAT